MDPDKYSTSNTHPPHVDLLEFDSGPPLGMTMAPGRRQSSAAGAVNPALDADLEHLAVHYRTHDLVCLLEDREMRYLNISDLETRCLANQIALHRVPMPDGGTPLMREMIELVELIMRQRDAGRQVVVHCLAGLGRTGTVAACCLVQDGMAPEHALSRVRAARPGTVETWPQEEFIVAFARSV